MSEWAPWEWFKNVKPSILPIDDPPCKHCKFWRPVALHRPDGSFDGVALCHIRNHMQGADMEGDFSCYQTKATP